MERARQTQDLSRHQTNHQPINQQKKTSLQAKDRDQKSGNLKNRRCRQWNGADKDQYAKLLLTYMMNNLEVNQLFMEHLAYLLEKTCKDVIIFHRRMLSEHKSISVIVTHLLRHKAQKRSHQPSTKQPTLETPQLALLEDFHPTQEEFLNGQQQKYLNNLALAERSLEEFQDDLSEDGEVYDLDDGCCEREERTNDSFDSKENNNERGNQEDKYSFSDCFID